MTSNIISRKNYSICLYLFLKFMYEKYNTYSDKTYFILRSIFFVSYERIYFC